MSPPHHDRQARGSPARATPWRAAPTHTRQRRGRRGRAVDPTFLRVAEGGVAVREAYAANETSDEEIIKQFRGAGRDPAPAGGHPGVRPGHEFALRAIDGGADTAAELGRRLAMTKQAAAKTITVLQQLGYVQRETDPEDKRANASG